MRFGIYIFVLLILFVGMVLAGFSPDGISLFVTGTMEAIIMLGTVFGILPVVQFSVAFQNALENIETAKLDRDGSAWTMIEHSEDFFRQRTLNSVFYEYQTKVKGQRESGQILSDIDDYINEDMLALHSWQALVSQIPGTLTGLGLLGTFIGLILGIQGIEFTSVNMALMSVQSLLAGIQVAFYTSIGGVILSLLFNLLYRMAWNTMIRQLGLFSYEFHRNVIPTVEEQTLYRERREIRQITELLDRLPRTMGYYASDGGEVGGILPSLAGDNEQIMMPQILSGIRDGDFVFYLQPIYNLSTKAVTGAEALVRWNHKKLGTLSPAVFVPVLERNGYITKLDQYIWKQVCATIRAWIDKGLRPVPVSINVTKTDVLAMDVAAYISGIVEEYDISPLNLVIEIAEKSYSQTPDAVVEAEKQLRQKGFKVVIDDFDGNYFSLSSIPDFSADLLKLDLRRFADSQSQDALEEVFLQARQQHYQVTALGVESMEQLTMLRKFGCTEGQGFYLSKPISTHEFETLIDTEPKEQR